MRNATYRAIYFPQADRYTALAYNYSQAVLLGTRDFATRGEARAELDRLCGECGVKLAWFEGDFVAVGNLLESDLDGLKREAQYVAA